MHPQCHAGSPDQAQWTNLTSTLWTAYAFNPRIVDMTFKPRQINQRESDHTWEACPLPFTTCSMICAHLNFTKSTKEKVTIPGKHVLCLSTCSTIDMTSVCRSSKAGKRKLSQLSSTPKAGCSKKVSAQPAARGSTSNDDPRIR